MFYAFSEGRETSKTWLALLVHQARQIQASSGPEGDSNGRVELPESLTGLDVAPV